MAQSKIEWTEFTVNPIRARWADRRDGDRSGHACEKVSPGCRFCYSSQQQHRFGLPRFDEAPEKYTNGEIELYLDEAVLQQVLRRRKPTRYFWCSMTDMFWRLVPEPWIIKCFAVMAWTGNHRHMVLTKRAERMCDVVSRLAKSINPLETAARELGLTFKFKSLNGREDFSMLPWPIPSIQLGVSAENQQYADERIPWLLKTPAAVRFVSYEPALGPVDLELFVNPLDGYDKPATHLDLVISGGESGPNARPAHPQWFRDARDACAVAGVAYFHKQNGEWAGPGKIPGPIRKVACHEFPDGTKVWRNGKHAAGRLLDGRTHDELPQ